MSNLNIDELSDTEIFSMLKDIAKGSIVQAVFAPTCFTPAPPNPTWDIHMNGEILSLSKEEAVIFIAGARAVAIWIDQQNAAV